MFADLRLRSSQIDLRSNNHLELMCLMQHHELPTRLLDWTESPLVAAFFATEKAYHEQFEDAAHDRFSVQDDPCIYVINAYRLNALTNLSLHRDSQIFDPRDVDVVVRSLMAEHTYLDSVVEKIGSIGYVARDRAYSEVMARLSGTDPDGRSLFLARLRAPVAVMPKRDHPRMDSQLSTFTIHGGKLYYDPEHLRTHSLAGWRLMGEPMHLEDLNRDAVASGVAEASGSQFMMRFDISRHAVRRIMVELDRLGITEPMLFPDIERQSRYVRRRWATIGSEKPILSLPHLGRALGERETTDSPEKQLYDWPHQAQPSK